MNRPHLVRGLRIAVSAVFGILCVLLIALWVRSYLSWDVYNTGTVAGQSATIGSSHGWLEVVIRTSSNDNFMSAQREYSLDSIPISEGWAENANWEVRASQYPWGSEYSIMIPHWLPAISAALFVAAPWIGLSNRFSLRTLLIATTLIAVALGLAAWAAAK